jgi:hypothetical protein
MHDSQLLTWDSSSCQAFLAGQTVYHRLQLSLQNLTVHNDKRPAAEPMVNEYYLVVARHTALSRALSFVFGHRLGGLGERNYESGGISATAHCK